MARTGDPNPNRSTWTDEQIELVRSRYRFCRSREDKEALARRAGIDSVASLYNLANRLQVTRPHQGGVGADYRVEEDRLLLRDPIDVPFDTDCDGYITRVFGMLTLDQIALHIERTESATLVRARQLGLRRFCKYWEAHRVCAWLSAPASQLTMEGVRFYVMDDPSESPSLVIASSSSLMRAISENGEVMLEHGADPHFIREITDMAEAISAGGDGPIWEANRWVSHEHICLNPWAGVSYGLFDDGSDLRIPCRELHPSDLQRRVSLDELDAFVERLRLP